MTAATTTMMLPDHSVNATAPQNTVLDTSVSTSNRSNSLYVDDEPWDERPSRQQVRSPLMACMESADQIMRNRMSCEFYDRQADVDDVPLEDGDLPPLSLKKNRPPPVGGRLVGGQLTTARPMSPPSKAGLVATEMDGSSQSATIATTTSATTKTDQSPGMVQKKQTQFWSQLDPPSPEDCAVNDSTTYEDVPEDELADRKTLRRRRVLDDDSKSRDEVETVDRRERPRVGVAETDSHSEANEDNLCYYTLQTLGNICGGGTEESPQRTILPTKRNKNMSLNRRVAPTYDVYEHTAIEVEYVEPPPPRDAEEKKEERDEATPGNWTPNRKNAYLATMARQAKEDFEKSQAQKDRANLNLSGTESPVPASPRSVSNEQDNLPDDVYNSFNATEKRKFLKLINSGLSSTESIKQVLAERKLQEQSPSPAAASEEAKSPGSKQAERVKIFSFWKKASHKGTIMQRARSAPKQRHLDGSGYEPTPQNEAYVNSSGYKSAPTSPMGPTTTTVGAIEAVSQLQTLENVTGRQSPVALSTQAVPSESIKSEREPPPQLPSFEAPVHVGKTNESSADNLSDAGRQGAPQAIAIAATAVSTTMLARDTKGLAELEGDNEGQEGQDRFAKSGIKYYDAVDKDRPEEEEDVDDEVEVASQSKSKSRTARLASIRLHPKAQGFSSLADQNEKAEHRARSRSLAEANRSATISPDGLRRKTLLGIPLRTTVSPTSFAALQDESTEIENPYEEADQILPPQESHTTVESVLNEPASLPMPRETVSSPIIVPSAVHQSSPTGPLDGIRSADAPNVVGGQEVAVQRVVEEELLRHTVPPTGISQIFDDGQLTVQSDLDLTSPSTLSLQPSQSTRMGRVEITGMDLGIDTYLDSTNIFSGGADHMSVISGRSGWTGVTGATMSSRKRRPGAARERLAKAREAENVRSPKGWHESIRAAAASTNRVWDPEKGWVDYKDPQAETHGERNSEKIRISLDTISLTSQKVSGGGDGVKLQSDEATKSPPVPVPFPEKWERERLEMLKGDSKPVKTVSNGDVSRSLSPNEVTRQRASSPYRGGAVAVSSAVTTSGGRPRETTPVRNDASSGNLDRSGETASSGAVRSVGRSAETTPVRGYHSIDQGDVSVGDLTEPMSNLNDWIEQSVDGHASKSELSFQDSITVATVDRTGGKYMQLGDNGSVKSLLHDPPPKTPSSLPVAKKSLFGNKKFSTPDRPEKIDEENDVSLPLLPASSSRQAKAPEVEVVKEMCDEDDIDLFNSKVTENVENNSVNLGSPSSRRSGPIDVDEVDEMSSSSEEIDDEWEADPFMLGIVSPSLLVRKKDSQAQNYAPAISPSNSGDASSHLPSQKSSASPSSRSIPKLSKSKKDTSPVRETQSSNPTPAKRGRMVPEASHPSSDQVSPVNDGFMSNSRSKLARAMAERRDVASAASSEAESFPENAVGVALNVTRAASTESQLDGSGRSASSIVKLRAQQWETRSSMSPVDFTNHEQPADQVSPGGVKSGAQQNRGASSATAEWKTFLGKKVRTESAVAARQQEDLKARANRPLKEPEGGHFRPLNQAALSGFNGNEFPAFDAAAGDGARTRGDEERDSLFDFEHMVKRHQRRGRESEQTENVFVDFAPVKGENRDGDDANHGNDGDVEGHRTKVEMEYVESEAGTVDKGSFLQRLKACAATDFPAAHLAFMRTNAGVKNISSRFMPATLCGTPDVILKDDATDDMDRESSVGMDGPVQQFPEFIRGKPRSRSTPRIETRPSSSSSVFSEEFGAKTAYLDAIAAKYAVSKPKRSDSRRREGRRSSASDVSVSSRRSQQSERWQAFLERKSAGGASPTKSRASSSTEISQAAEKYAAEKVEEIMAAMSSSRSKSTPRSWPHQQKDVDDPRYRVGELIDSDNISTASSSSPQPRDKPKTQRKSRKNDSARAAEELAAARVEAMMAAMSSSRELDEGEI